MFSMSRRRVKIRLVSILLSMKHIIFCLINQETTIRHGRIIDFLLLRKSLKKVGNLVFLTLSSQRPADISPTLLSQVHNFFLHKLVNERDLQIIDNSLSTLDRVSKSMLPGLSQGICIITGTALSLPMIVNVDFISDKLYVHKVILWI